MCCKVLNSGCSSPWLESLLDNFLVDCLFFVMTQYRGSYISSLVFQRFSLIIFLLPTRNCHKLYFQLSCFLCACFITTFKAYCLQIVAKLFGLTKSRHCFEAVILLLIFSSGLFRQNYFSLNMGKNKANTMLPLFF